MAEVFAPVERTVQLNYYVTQQQHHHNNIIIIIIFEKTEHCDVGEI
jgi:hypothetical protein